MRRLAVFVVAGLMLALCGTEAASAGEGSWSRWEPTSQGAITVAAGVVCPFGVSAEPVRQDLRIRYHTNDAGAVDGYEVTGPLVGRITNTETGASVVRNLSGLGVVTLNPDGSYDALADGNFLLFFRTGDSPSNELLLLHGRTLLHGSPTGQKTLVSSTGRSEDLCKTLA